ncbi:MAG: DMT family transporter [Chloroflexi bacterium]|nr:DMT family transporter [Chloroflexota bacterium]PWB48287.1 MAG: EamA family transporter [Dehalococcoidia bacterium]
MTPRQFAILCILAVTWGCSFLFIRVIVDSGVGPLGMSSLRTLLGGLSLIPFAWHARAGFRQSRGTWIALAGLGFMNFAVPWTIFGIAGSRVPSGVAAIANSTAPLWVAMLSVPFLKAERVSGLKAFGLGLGFLGIVVLMGDDITHLRGAAALSILLILVATFSYGGSAVFIRKHLGHVPPIVLASGQIGFATLFLAPLALATGSYAGDWDTNVVLSALALGALGSGIAVAAYMWLIQEAGPVSASVVTYLIPPVGVFVGWLVLDERIGWNMLGGLACILAGVAFVQGFPLRRLAGRRPAAPLPAPAGGD